jgi:hypothetical protein
MAVNGIKTLQDFTINVSKESKEAISGVYRPKGSVYFANLPALTKERIGFVYDIKDAFTTTSDFVEGSGKDYPIGTNVVILEDEQGNLKYDCLAGIVVQESGLPAVTSSDNGKILKVVDGEWDKADNGNGYVEYVTDGTKTYKQALFALAALIDINKISPKSMLVIDDMSAQGTPSEQHNYLVCKCSMYDDRFANPISFYTDFMIDMGSGMVPMPTYIDVSYIEHYCNAYRGQSLTDFGSDNCGHSIFRLYY